MVWGVGILTPVARLLGWNVCFGKRLTDFRVGIVLSTKYRGLSWFNMMTPTNARPLCLLMVSKLLLRCVIPRRDRFTTCENQVS